MKAPVRVKLRPFRSASLPAGALVCEVAEPVRAVPS